MNPEACEHEPKDLKLLHPYDISNRYNHSQSIRTAYIKKQCHEEEGYWGLFCGTCLKGYGSTAPFQCQHCAGADENGVVSKGTMSGLWVYYWFVLVAWYVFTVSTSMPETPGPTPTDSEAKHFSEFVYVEAGPLDIAKVSEF
jgi:hypothetical protein